MTLSTKIVIGGGAIVAESVYTYVRTLLKTPEGAGVHRISEGEVYEHIPNWTHDYSEISTPPGSGVCAWLIVKYHPDSPLIHKCDSDCGEVEEDGTTWCERKRAEPDGDGRGAVLIDLDTAYGYKQPGTGAGCSDLHAWVIEQMVEYYGRQGRTIWWKNEFNGEWHEGTDGFHESYGREGHVDFVPERFDGDGRFVMNDEEIEEERQRIKRMIRI